MLPSASMNPGSLSESQTLSYICQVSNFTGRTAEWSFQGKKRVAESASALTKVGVLMSQCYRNTAAQTWKLFFINCKPFYSLREIS